MLNCIMQCSQYWEHRSHSINVGFHDYTKPKIGLGKFMHFRYMEKQRFFSKRVEKMLQFPNIWFLRADYKHLVPIPHY